MREVEYSVSSFVESLKKHIQYLQDFSKYCLSEVIRFSHLSEFLRIPSQKNCVGLAAKNESNQVLMRWLIGWPFTHDFLRLGSSQWIHFFITSHKPIEKRLLFVQAVFLTIVFQSHLAAIHRTPSFLAFECIRLI